MGYTDASVDTRTTETCGDASILGLEAEAAKQIACADVLVLNKIDLVPKDSDRENVTKRVTSMNPSATVLESTRAVVPLDAILGIGAFDRQRLATSLANLE